MVQISYYSYDPSLPAAAIFTVLFGISSVLHIWYTIRKRSWFLIAFIIGGLFETIGYAARIVSAHDKTLRGPFIVQTLLLLLGPVLFAASIYMILARIIVLTDGQRYALVRPSWITVTFVGGDIMAFVMQGAGAAIFTSADGDADKAQRGEDIVVGGLFAQLAFFGFFLVVSAVYQLRARAHLLNLPDHIHWKKHHHVLYATSTLILLRSIVRVVEFLMGYHGYIYTHEVFLYVFDAVLMLAVMVAMTCVHPGDIAIMLRERQRDDNSIDMGRGEPSHK